MHFYELMTFINFPIFGEDGKFKDFKRDKEKHGLAMKTKYPYFIKKENSRLLEQINVFYLNFLFETLLFVWIFCLGSLEDLKSNISQSSLTNISDTEVYAKQTHQYMDSHITQNYTDLKTSVVSSFTIT